jgi:hypothetical protein
MPFSATPESLTCLRPLLSAAISAACQPSKREARPEIQPKRWPYVGDKHTCRLDWVAIEGTSTHRHATDRQAVVELADHRLDVQRLEPRVLMESSTTNEIGRGASSSRRHQNARKNSSFSTARSHGKDLMPDRLTPLVAHLAAYASALQIRWRRLRAVLRFGKKQVVLRVDHHVRLVGQVREHPRMRPWHEPTCATCRSARTG